MNDKILEEIRQVSKEYPDGIHRRSEAREMFDNLEYEYEKDEGKITYKKSLLTYKIHTYIIEFNLLYKTIRKKECVGNNVYYSSFSVKELQAVDKQVKELGWLNE